MNESKRTSSFWTTLPGILTGFAGLITAVATLVAVGMQVSGSNGGGGGGSVATPPARTTTAEEAQTVSWASEANRLCGDTLREVRALGTPQTPDDLVVYLPRAIDANWRLHAELRELSADSGAEDAVESLLGKLAFAIDRGEGLLQAIQSLDQVGVAQEWDGLRSADAEFDNAAIALGASACAQD
jgi:hypothetical protein